MKRFYIDTNIIIDFISLREPFGENAVHIFELAAKSKIKIYASTHEFATAHYILRKVYSEEKVREILESLFEYIEIVDVTEGVLKKAIRSTHKDFEDAIQIFCAHQIKNLDGIITRNLKDFSSSEIPVFPPDEAINYIKNN